MRQNLRGADRFFLRARQQRPNVRVNARGRKCQGAEREHDGKNNDPEAGGEAEHGYFTLERFSASALPTAEPVTVSVNSRCVTVPSVCVRIERVSFPAEA